MLILNGRWKHLPDWRFCREEWEAGVQGINYGEGRQGKHELRSGEAFFRRVLCWNDCRRSPAGETTGSARRRLFAQDTGGLFFRQFYVGTEKDCTPEFLPRSIGGKAHCVDGIHFVVVRGQRISADLHFIIGSKHSVHEVIALFSNVTEHDPDFPDGEILIVTEVGIYDDIISIGEGQIEVTAGSDGIFDIILVKQLLDVVINLRFFGEKGWDDARQKDKK